MIDFRNDVNKEIVSFLRKSIPIDIPIYNSDALTTKPNKNTRVEYSLRNFNSTGQTKSYTKKNVNSLKAYSFTGYDCQLVIRVIAKQETANLVANEIAGAMQTFEFLENYVNGLDIKNETMRIKTIPVDVNGLVYNMIQIIVDCYTALEFERDIKYFDRVGDIEIIIK